MKAALAISLSTAYDDGAGNTCNYVYAVAAKSFSYVATKHWKLRMYRAKLPTTTITLVAASRNTVVGAPPAANTRSVTITAQGVVTPGANETITDLSGSITLSEVEEHPYEYMSQCMPDLGTLIDTYEVTVSGVPTENKDAWKSQVFIADADLTWFKWTISTTGIAQSKIPSVYVLMAETDLITREYAGQYAELGAKALVGVLQAMNKQYAGIAAQAYQYAAGTGSPIALELVPALHECLMGS